MYSFVNHHVHNIIYDLLNYVLISLVGSMSLSRVSPVMWSRLVNKKHVTSNEEVSAATEGWWECVCLCTVCCSVVCVWGSSMTHREAALRLNLLLFLHVVAQVWSYGPQQWPVPYRYEDKTVTQLVSMLSLLCDFKSCEKTAGDSLLRSFQS